VRLGSVGAPLSPMKLFPPTLLALYLLSASLLQAEIVPPKTPDGVEAKLIASEPLIKHPIGLCFDHHDRLLVVESHTHFPPDDYEGPDGDRILWLKDNDGDEVADEAVVLFEGLQNACNIKPHPNGWIYISARNEVLRIRDADGDGKAEDVERRILWMETEANHPHNGISGLAFDAEGNVFVGMGENLGGEYTMQGTDGREVTDAGEGGNVWRINAEGGELVRFATGFWNPFGLAVDRHGNLFASDNDPSSAPPSRLHRVIEGGDYGFLYRYGRSGQHPFVAWNGELPGTIPMLAPVGEAPCDIALYETQDATHVLVTSWVDHWIEMHRFTEDPEAGSQRSILLQGGSDFRPAGIDWSPDGKSVYISDWVKRAYQLHGFGGVWKFTFEEPQEMKPHWDYSIAPIPDVTLEDIGYVDAWAESKFITQLSRDPERLKGIDMASVKDELARSAVLLAWQRSQVESRHEMIEQGLEDPAAVVRLLALKWIADEQLSDYREQVDQILETESDPDLFFAALTTRARFEGGTLNDNELAVLLRERVLDEELPASARLAALKVYPKPEDTWKAPQLARLLNAEDLDLRTHALRLMTQLSDPGKRAVLEAFIEDERQPESLRHFALAGLPERPLEESTAPRDPNRPPSNSLPHPWLDWFETLPGEPDLENGRFVFFHPMLGNCSMCHQIEGIGRTGGPDLSSIGEMDERHILASVLNPAIEVAPQYQPWLIHTTDGRKLYTFQLGERGGTHWYSDIGGNVIELKIEQIESREQIGGTMMPQGLFDRLSDAQVRDLVAYLASLYN